MFDTLSFPHRRREPSTEPEKHNAAVMTLPDLILAAGRLASLLVQGRHSQRRSGTGEKFWQFRPHQPHEPASLIDWRQSARAPQPDLHWVRERERETPRPLTLWVDHSASMQWRSHKTLPFKRDIALTAALALGQAAFHAGEHVAVPGQKRGYLNARQMPRLTHDVCRSSNIPDIHQVPPHAQLLLVSDFLWDETTCMKVLSLCRRRPGRTFLLAVLDPAERTLPYKGRIRFSDPEGGPALVLPAVDQFKASYEQEIEAHFARLRALAGKHLLFIQHLTNASLLPPLMALHQNLGGKA